MHPTTSPADDALWSKAGPERPALWESSTFEQLHATFPDRDRILIGWNDIAGWLASIGFEVSPRTVEHWPRLFGMPCRRGSFGGWRRQQPITSAFALIAWLLCSPRAARLRGSSGRIAKRNRLDRPGRTRSFAPRPQPEPNPETTAHGDPAA